MLPSPRHTHTQILKKAMATHSSTFAWKIPWTEELGRLQSMGLRRVGHEWATSLSLFTFMYWRRKWQPTPVFLPGEPQGWWSLVCCHLWGRRHNWSDLAAAAAAAMKISLMSSIQIVYKVNTCGSVAWFCGSIACFCLEMISHHNIVLFGIGLIL